MRINGRSFSLRERDLCAERFCRQNAVPGGHYDFSELELPEVYPEQLQKLVPFQDKFEHTPPLGKGNERRKFARQHAFQHRIEFKGERFPIRCGKIEIFPEEGKRLFGVRLQLDAV